ncbi:hypothetical protein BCT30_23810 [Enterovibrio norvegicus]|uniref:Uncharacterized protein n=1 Tax=Enterovibrio norvegicus TaxID=188144 RepID=A0A2N7LAL1_9GAMM|nr:hypothetical protein BCU47_17900 [Enterovibrio norvegicus]PMI41312.1 hypothetical protein BCU46_23975 [Enterovibrio norvegicus]PMN44162.1 hypothetical protein BCT30_23810 [Enterovibrio norvegicus]PMN91855.1 hypothetical protein BCT23_16085 [Enterovibrio norvegicus]
MIHLKKKVAAFISSKKARRKGINGKFYIHKGETSEEGLIPKQPQEATCTFKLLGYKSAFWLMSS